MIFEEFKELGFIAYPDYIDFILFNFIFFEAYFVIVEPAVTDECRFGSW